MRERINDDVVHVLQVKKEPGDLEEVTHKVYFDVEIGGKPVGMHSVQFKLIAEQIL